MLNRQAQPKMKSIGGSKMLRRITGFFILIFLPIFVFAQNVEDIVVPEGYQVRKIASTNGVPDIVCWAFDLSGNIIAGMGAGIWRIDQAGEVEVLCTTRRYGFGASATAPLSDGSFLVIGSRLDSPTTYSIYKYTPPGQFDLQKSDVNPTSSLNVDKKGNYYGFVFYTSPQRGYKIIRYDSSFNEIEIVAGLKSLGAIVFDNSNNMYFNQPGEAKIWKVEAGSNGIPDSEDPLTEVVTIENQSRFLAIDENGLLYVPQLEQREKDGDSIYQIYRLLRVNPSTGSYDSLVSGLADPYHVCVHNGYIYFYESDRGVIAKIDALGKKTDLTSDYGMTAANYVLLGADDRLYTTDFRQRKMFLLNEDGTFEQYGPGIGWTITGDVDDKYIYLGSGPDDALGQILKIDPVAGTRESIRPSNPIYIRFQTIALDSYGRIGNVALMQDYRWGINILDLQTKEAKPYVLGLNNTGRALQFDSQQNLYIKEGQGDGMKKVPLLKDYDPPLDIANVPLFLDFRMEQYPPAIGWYHVNDLEDIYIPLIDTGRILRADKYGEVRILADGFRCPYFVSVDRYGRMFVSDWGNGIFEIISLQLEISTLNELIQEIQKISLESRTLLSLSSQQTDASSDFYTSLVAKLENAVRSLERQNKVAAIKIIKAFQNEVRAQQGKKIPVDTAESWLKTTTGIIRVLQEL